MINILLYQIHSYIFTNLTNYHFQFYIVSFVYVNCRYIILMNISSTIIALILRKFAS